LSALGIALCETLTCRHDEAALAGRLTAARGEILLILTASATSDSRDTAPEALCRAGGTLTRFGIPVDPGNLLFLGALGERPVIGLPNSARSPVLHGADWVLGRVACGLEISPHDFAAMGVGGLLKEIPTRPQPRRGPRG
jgi:molybdenum cofactor cytidylyltransferase